MINLPIEHTILADWKNQHPQTEVFSKDTGFSRAYGHSPHGDYDENGDIITPCHSAVVCIILKKESSELSSMASLKPIPLRNCHSLNILSEILLLDKKLPLNSILKAGTELSVILKEKFCPG